MESNDSISSTFKFLDFLIIISTIGCLYDIYTFFNDVEISEKINELPPFLATDLNISFLENYDKYKLLNTIFSVFSTFIISFSLYLMHNRQQKGFAIYIFGQVISFITLALVFQSFLVSSFLFILIPASIMIILYSTQKKYLLN